MSEGALEGFVVIDASDGIAGAFCTKLLASLGAEVIVIEPPNRGNSIRGVPPFLRDVPDRETSTLHLHLGMAKKSITLDLESPRGCDLFRRLVSGADVLIEGWTNAWASEHGLDDAALRSLRPDLIITSVTYFGRTGPYADFQGSELVAYSAGGYSYLTGLPDREPIKAGGSQAEHQGGLHAAAGTLAALCLRDLTGAGDLVDVSIAESICYTHAGMPAYFNIGSIFQRVGARLLNDSPTNLYPSTILPCKDGFVHVHWAPTDPALLGILTETPRLSDPELWETARGHADEMDTLMMAWLSQYDKFEVARRAQELRHPWTEVLDPSELLEDEQFKSRGFFVEIEHPVAGSFQHLGPSLLMTETPCQVAPAPLLGQHNLEVFRDRLGLSDSELAALREGGVI